MDSIQFKTNQLPEDPADQTPVARARKRRKIKWSCLVSFGLVILLCAGFLEVVKSSFISAKRSSTLAALNQLGKSTSLYLADFDDVYPYASSVEEKYTRCPGETPSKLPIIHDVLKAYIKSNGLWHDALDTGIPSLPADQITEKIECQLSGTTPKLHEKYGTSYVYRSELGTKHVSVPFEMVASDSGKVLDMSQVALFHSAYGNWLGGPDIARKKYVTAYADGHVGVAPFAVVHQQGTYRTAKDAPKLR